MGRPERHDVDYFPFFAKSGKTLDYLELKYGPEGTGYFTNILRFLSLTPDHYFCIKEETDKMVFLSRIKTTDEKKTMDIIEIMVKTGKLDRQLWEEHKVIASEAFLESLEEAYKKRNNKIISLDEIKAIFEKNKNDGVSGAGNPEKVTGNPAVCVFPVENLDNNPQSKVKKSKVKKSKYIGGSDESREKEKSKKPPLREREPTNDFEKVEKAYMLNWETLYLQKMVKRPDPIVNWNQTRALLKKHFEKLKPEQIIQAIDDGMKDEWILNGGYSLGVMLSASVLNRLVNAGKAGTPSGLENKKSLKGLGTWN